MICRHQEKILVYLIFIAIILFAAVFFGKHFIGKTASTSEQRTFRWLSISNAQHSDFEVQNGIVSYNNRIEGEIVFPDADARTFLIATYQDGTSTAYTGYAKDKNQAYYFSYAPAPLIAHYPLQAYAIPGADIDTFIPLYSNGIDVESVNYAEDKNYIYESGGRLAVDRATFALISDGANLTYYSKDKNHIYYLGSIIPGADPVTFGVLNDRYAKDKNHVYCVFAANGEIAPIPIKVVGADATTFTVLDDAAVVRGNCGSAFSSTCEFDAYDKTQKYFAGVVVPQS